MTTRTAGKAVLPRWGVLALAVAAGAAGVLAQAPFNLAVFMLVPLLAGAWLYDRSDTPRSAFACGFSLGFGYFAFTLSWIVEPFQVDAAAHGWMAPFALILLASGFGLIWAAGFALARWLSAHPMALVVGWGLAEAFRAYAFTGFPWANPAQGLLHAATGYALPWVGPIGLTLLAFAASCSVIVLWRQRAAIAGTVIAILLVSTLVPRQHPQADLTDYTVRLVQPNASQQEKWDPDLAPQFVQKQLDDTAAPGTPDLVVWGEMAIPYRATVSAPVFEAAAAAAQGAPVVMGALRDAEDGAFYNSAFVTGSDGEILQYYDKRHLVPFGEYMPLPALFRATGIRALADRTESGYSKGSTPVLFDFGSLGKALPLICYEAVFPQDLRGTDRPDFLIQITNDAWFGMSLGPQQHLAQAQMRALEQGLPLVRVGGTGISAMIDGYGRVTASIPLNTAGYLDAALPAPLSPTLYSRTGDAPYLLLLLMGLAVLTFRRFRR